MNVLAVFAHPDDEVLGCGGTLAKHAENGDYGQIIACCKTRANEGRQAAATTLGIKHYACLGHDDQKLDTLPFTALVNSICYRIVESPDIIYTHHPGDLNQDHALTAKAVLTAFRPKPGEKARTILACEVASSTEWTFPQVFQPNYFVGLGWSEVEKKCLALECYETEVQEFPHPRSRAGISYAAAFRGQQSGVHYAEAFQVLRIGPL